MSEYIEVNITYLKLDYEIVLHFHKKEKKLAGKHT